MHDDDEVRLCLSLRGCRHGGPLTDRRAIGPFMAGAVASALFILIFLSVWWGY